MKLSDLLKPSQSISDAYAPGGFFNPQAGPLANKVLQTSINKSSPGFKQTTTNQSGTPVATDVITAPTVPTPEPIRDGKGNPIATPVDWYANYAYLAGQGDKSAQDWMEQNYIDDTQPTNNGGIDFSTPTTDVAYGAEQMNKIYGSRTPEELWALRQQLRINQAEQAQGWDQTQVDPNQPVQSLNDIRELLARQRSDAASGMLPNEGMDYRLPGMAGTPGYTFGDINAVNKSKADIFGTQISALDQFVADKARAATTNNQMTDNERALMTQFLSSPIVKDYNTVISSKNLVDGIVQNFQGGSSDIAEIYAFMKALDPNSVVREAEYDTAALNAGNFFQGKFAKLNGMFKEGGGFLSEDARKQFQNVVNGAVLSKQKQYEPLARQFREIAKRQGMNPDNVVIDFSQGIGDTGKNSSSSGITDAEKEKLKQQGYTDAEINGLLGFNQVGSGTNKASKVVAGYDISSYATDPNHERSVATIYQRTPQFKSPTDIDIVIRKVAPKSKITGSMIATAANTYGVDPKMVYAMMLQDSSLGTAGMGARNNNPGNIGQYDNLNRPVAGYRTLQDGVNAVAKWLSKKKVSPGRNYA